MSTGERKPLILAVDADADSRTRITSELQRYSRDYTVICGASSHDALASLESLRGEGAPVALVLAAQDLPELTGSELLARVHAIHPHAKRALLIPWGGWGDEETAEAIRLAMALGHIDYYVLRPTRPPDELFHRIVSEFLHEWARANLTGDRREIALVADPWSKRGYELRNLLARNGVPHSFHPSDSAEGRHALDEAGLDAAQCPVVLLPGGDVLVDPTNAELARGYGVATELESSPEPFEVAIVGAGPAGLAAAVYASSEGLRTARRGARGDRRPGRLELAHPELPRLRARDLGRRARTTRVPAGVGLRHDLPAHARGEGASNDRRRPARALDLGRDGRRDVERRPRRRGHLSTPRDPGARRADRERCRSTVRRRRTGSSSRAAGSSSSAVGTRRGRPRSI